MNRGPSKRGIGPEGVAALILLAALGLGVVAGILVVLWLTGLVLDLFGNVGR